MKIKKHLGKRLLASLLAAVSLIPVGIGTPVSAAESTYPIVLKEKNPFDGFYSPKQNNGSVASCNANIMECVIDGENYLAYCLNPDRKGSDNINGNVGESGYGVEVHDLSDPETTSALDYNILLAMQGVIAAGGYLGGGDEAAQKLMDPYQPDRQLYHDRFQAYALTKYAMWTLSQGWTTTDWKINSSASYKPQDLEYLYTSLGDIIGWGTNWTKPNDESLYLIPQDDGGGELWQTDGEEKYIEYQVKSGRTGDNRRDVPISAAYTVVPGTLPDGFRLEKMDGTPITGATEIPAAEHFRVAASGNPESVPEGTEIARVTAEIQSYSIKYGVGMYSGGRVQNYALVPENPWKEVSVPVMLEFTPTETEAKFQIKKTDGSGTGLAGAEFEVTSEDGSWSDTVTTPSSGVVTVDVPEPGRYYVQETKAPSGGYALDPTRYSATVEENSTETVTLTIRNNKSTSLKILKLSAQDDSSLAGAVFEVRNIGTGWSTEVVTGNGGLAIVNDIEPGDYQITEKSPPAGYWISENPVQTIKLEADKVGQVVYKNEPVNGTVRILKTAENDGAPLSGVTFTIRRRDGAEQWSVTTDENGEANRTARRLVCNHGN